MPTLNVVGKILCSTNYLPSIKKLPGGDQGKGEGEATPHSWYIICHFRPLENSRKVLHLLQFKYEHKRLRHLDFDSHTEDSSLAWPPTMPGLCSNLQQYSSLDYAAKLAADASVLNLSLAVCFRKNELEKSASSALYQPQKTARNHEVKLRHPWRILEHHCHILILQFHPLSWKDI